MPVWNRGSFGLCGRGPFLCRAGLPQISAEASSSNGRTVGGLLKSSANGKLPLYQADALSSNKDRAFGEYGDFLNQLHARDPGRVAGFEKDVMERLPSATKVKLATYFNQTAKAKPASSNRRSLLTGTGSEDMLSNSSVRSKKQMEQSSPAFVDSGDKFTSPINRDFRDELNNHESKADGYKAFNPKGDGIGALGRYQMRKGALKDAGMLDKKGNWTGKHGVKSAEDFLRNPQAQERAFATYMPKVKNYLQNNGSMKFLGKTFPGVKKEGIKITESGLLGAAHRAGQGGVKQYLDFQKENSWSSDFSKVKDISTRKLYEQVETRLRTFQNKRYQ